jgi:hypothetical protein
MIPADLKNMAPGLYLLATLLLMLGALGSHRLEYILWQVAREEPKAGKEYYRRYRLVPLIAQAGSVLLFNSTLLEYENYGQWGEPGVFLRLLLCLLLILNPVFMLNPAGAILRSILRQFSERVEYTQKDLDMYLTYIRTLYRRFHLIHYSLLTLFLCLGIFKLRAW